MVADALRYTQEASFPKLIAKSMRVRAPFWIQKWLHSLMDLKRPATNGETDMFYEGSNPSGVTNRKVGRVGLIRRP